MENYGCTKRGLTNCEIVGLFLAIIFGVGIGVLFSLDLIPIALNFIIVALVAAAISIIILLGSLFTANLIRGCNGFYICICRFAKFVLTGSIGTLLAATAAVTAGITVTSIASIIFVAITTFFFILMVVSIICLFSCLIKQTCTRKEEL